LTGPGTGDSDAVSTLRTKRCVSWAIPEKNVGGDASAVWGRMLLLRNAVAMGGYV